MKNKFEVVLQDDEEVIKIEKSKKMSFVFSLFKNIPVIFLTAFFTTFVALPTVSSVFHNNIQEGVLLFLKIWICLNILILFIRIIGSFNYYVCLTNKRVIIRKGVFTNNFSFYSIERVTGNITTNCIQSIFDTRNGVNDSCSIKSEIELLPVGHGNQSILIDYIQNGYNFVKELEKIVKINASLNNVEEIKE